MARGLLALLALMAVVLAVGASPPAQPAGAGPLAQATATNTPAPTATLPPSHDLGSGWGVQALPAAGVNCVYETTVARGIFFSCVSGTPVP